MATVRRMVNQVINTAAKMQAISSADAPPPGGHYSQAVVHQGLVYVSGQLPVIGGKPHDPSASFETQVRRALANLSAVLAASNSSTDKILKVSAYIVGAENWPLPIPLVNKGGSWSFDIAAAKNEVLYRRIGNNEMAAIFACGELVEAQRQYFADGKAEQYASSIAGDPAKREGLFAKEAEPAGAAAGG